MYHLTLNEVIQSVDIKILLQTLKKYGWSDERTA